MLNCARAQVKRRQYQWYKLKDILADLLRPCWRAYVRRQAQSLPLPEVQEDSGVKERGPCTEAISVLVRRGSRQKHP
jgi:hypothetical protein